jgi:fatty-acyl-CoA synthase
VSRGEGTGIGVGSWIERRARTSPHRAALIAGDRTVSFAELAERVRRLANGLRGLGVGHGDRVAWIGPNHAAFLEALFAVGRLGAVLAPVNHRLAPEERARILEDTEPLVLLEHAATPTRVLSSLRHRLVVGGATGPGAEPGDRIDYEAFVADSTDETIDEQVDLDDLLLLPHTSGTTGGPKGVMLTHGNVTWNVVNMLSLADLRGDDVTIAIAPFFRVGGTGVNVLPVLFLGGSVVVPDRIDGPGILELVARHGVTVGFGNPDLLDAIARAEAWPTADLSSVRFVITGGAPVPERLIRLYHDRGVPLVQGYGLSEAAPVVLLLDAGSSLRKVGSAGRPPLFVDIRIVDRDLRDVAPGEAGELLARGPNVMAGYWRRPADTAKVLLPGGWLRTGDAARMDDEGDVWIVDRVDAAFVAGGRVVYPGDVERALMTHPAVADAGVVGRSARDGGAVAMAFVVLAPGHEAGEAELLGVARERLAPHEVPGSITFVDELPRSLVGKLLRGELRARAQRPQT